MYIKQRKHMKSGTNTKLTSIFMKTKHNRGGSVFKISLSMFLRTKNIIYQFIVLGKKNHLIKLAVFVNDVLQRPKHDLMVMDNKTLLLTHFNYLKLVKF